MDIDNHIAIPNNLRSLMPKDENGDIDSCEAPDVLTNNISKTVFHIGQSYEKSPCETLQCSICGNTQFQVGKGSLYTAIRCPTCEWELCIHEG